MKPVENYKDVTIVIIDDEIMNLELIGYIVEKLGCNVIKIQNSLEALPILLEKRPDLILLDVQMPKMDGFELCQLINKETQLNEIPIIFITGMDKPEQKVKGLELGGVDYVGKPFNPAELRARVKTHIDLSLAKRKLAEQALKLKEEILLKNRIFSIIGHDLRSPLSAAKLNIDFIIRGIIDVKKEGFIDDTVFGLSRTIEEALNLLQNLLGWGRSESNQLEIIPETFDIYEIIEETFRLLRINSTHKQINLINNVQPNSFVFADLNTIKTVLRNLLSNAIKFTPKLGEINVNTKSKNNKVIIEIADNGEGISKENLKKILSPEEHFSKLGTDKEPGTGLGLVLCQDFIYKNGGTLKVKSNEGQGSVFYFDLPNGKILNTKQ